MRDTGQNCECTHCKRSGHEASDCFQLVGYPDWWGDRPRDTKLAGRGRGTIVGGRGRGGALRANVAQATPGATSGFNGEQQGMPKLNSEQGASLVELINSHKANSAKKLTGKTENTS